MSLEYTLDKREIIKRILVADQELNKVVRENEKVELILIGASAFLLKDLISRRTNDIDTYTIEDAEVKKILISNDINGDGSSIMTICEDFNERLDKVNLPLKNIDLYILGDYNLIISKLGHRTRPQDFQDIIESKLIYRINFDFLEKLLKEKLFTPTDEGYLWSEFRILKSYKENQAG